MVAAGNVFLQLPIGILADKMNRQRLLVICAGAGLFGGISLPLVIGVPWLLWPTLFLWGGVVVGLYTVGLTMLGERFSGPDLVGANAAFVMLYGLGALAAPPVAGAAMDLWNPHGLGGSLALLCLGFIIIAFWKRSNTGSASQGLDLGTGAVIFPNSKARPVALQTRRSENGETGNG
ncbi:MAG: MFS transporter [Sphingomonadales bacterium]